MVSITLTEQLSYNLIHIKDGGARPLTALGERLLPKAQIIFSVIMSLNMVNHHTFTNKLSKCR